MNKIHEKLKNLPALPGVYLMKSASGNIIYVGKSKMLKNRVRQYFQNSEKIGKVQAMVENIADFEYIVTDTEMEALVLECNLIKKHKPYYNILLKDSKQYPYIKLTLNEPYPRMLLARKILKDDAKYFGPYTAGVASDTMDVIKKAFKIATCKRVFPRDIGKERPCLNYHINLCAAPCINKVTQEEYRQIFSDICDFLSGDISGIIKRLKLEMLSASENMEFEKAADLRDKITRIESMSEKQKITLPGGGDKDIIAVVTGEIMANVQIFNVREGKLIGRNQMWLDFSLNETDKEILSKFIAQYYMESEFIPKEILINIMPEDEQVIGQWLSEKAGHKVVLRVPQKGKGLDIIKMAVKNANQAIEEQGKLKQAQKEQNKQAIEELQNSLGIMPLQRIEAFDISNTQGQNSVGSMVVFENGVPENSEYRHFKIKTVDKIDDYASTKEVVTRRLARLLSEREEKDSKFNKMPDVIFADGGYAHAVIINEAASGVGLNIPVFGMVKDAHHRTKALINTDGEIIALSQNAFRLIAEIQEEVHRVAISYHRKLMDADMKRSALDSIPGIGAKRKKQLLRTFGSVAGIKNATVAEIAAVDGISAAVAENIYRYLND